MKIDKENSYEDTLYFDDESFISYNNYQNGAYPLFTGLHKEVLNHDFQSPLKFDKVISPLGFWVSDDKVAFLVPVIVDDNSNKNFYLDILYGTKVVLSFNEDDYIR